MNHKIRLLLAAFGICAVICSLWILSRRGDDSPNLAPADGYREIPPDLSRKEAPMLEALVAQRKLPPLDDRLPKNPRPWLNR